LPPPCLRTYRRLDAILCACLLYSLPSAPRACLWYNLACRFTCACLNATPPGHRSVSERSACLQARTCLPPALRYLPRALPLPRRRRTFCVLPAAACYCCQVSATLHCLPACLQDLGAATPIYRGTCGTAVIPPPCCLHLRLRLTPQRVCRFSAYSSYSGFHLLPCLHWDACLTTCISRLPPACTASAGRAWNSALLRVLHVPPACSSGHLPVLPTCLPPGWLIDASACSTCWCHCLYILHWRSHRLVLPGSWVPRSAAFLLFYTPAVLHCTGSGSSTACCIPPGICLPLTTLLDAAACTAVTAVSVPACLDYLATLVLTWWVHLLFLPAPAAWILYAGCHLLGLPQTTPLLPAACLPPCTGNATVALLPPHIPACLP